MGHCHNLKHATTGEVAHLMYEGVDTPLSHRGANGGGTRRAGFACPGCAGGRYADQFLATHPVGTGVPCVFSALVRRRH